MADYSFSELTPEVQKLIREADRRHVDMRPLAQWIEQGHGRTPGDLPSGAYLDTDGTPKWEYDFNYTAAILGLTGAAAPLLLPYLGVGSGGAAAGASTGGTAAGTAATGSAVGTAAAPVVAGTTGAATAATAAAGAGAGGTSLWRILQGAAGVVTPVIGAAIQANAASEGRDAQLAATEKALAQQQAQYEQTRGDLAPYRDLGSGSANKLKFLMGIS